MTEYVAPTGRAYLIEQSVVFDLYTEGGVYIGTFPSPLDAERAADSHAETTPGVVVQ